MWLISRNKCRIRAKSGRSRPTLVEVEPSFVQSLPSMAEFEASLAKFAEPWPNSSQIWPHSPKYCWSLKRRGDRGRGRAATLGRKSVVCLCGSWRLRSSPRGAASARSSPGSCPCMPRGNHKRRTSWLRVWFRQATQVSWCEMLPVDKSLHFVLRRRSTANPRTGAPHHRLKLPRSCAFVTESGGERPQCTNQRSLCAPRPLPGSAQGQRRRPKPKTQNIRTARAANFCATSVGPSACKACTVSHHRCPRQWAGTLAGHSGWRRTEGLP